jgi:hypothetical protein
MRTAHLKAAHLRTGTEFCAHLVGIVVENLDGHVDDTGPTSTVHLPAGRLGTAKLRPSTTTSLVSASVRAVVPSFHSSDDDRR